MAGNNQTKLTIRGRGFAEIAEALKQLSEKEVLVGFPESEEERLPTEEGGDPEPSNAVLGYIHDNGAPEVNIPARPFMQPGIEEVKDKITDKLAQTLRAVLRGDGIQRVDQGLTQVGFIAMNSIKRTINAGVPPPLSDATLRQRMRGGRKNGGGARKGAAQELDRRWDGQAPSVEFAKPLVDTGQMRNAVNYVIRQRK